MSDKKPISGYAELVKQLNDARIRLDDRGQRLVQAEKDLNTMRAGFNAEKDAKTELLDCIEAGRALARLASDEDVHEFDERRDAILRRYGRLKA